MVIAEPTDVATDTTTEFSATNPAHNAKEKLSIAELRLSFFRNYTQIALTTDARPVILTGENGAGKTNILEAISLLFPGRGLRKTTLDALSHQSSDSTATSDWAIAAKIRTKDGIRKLGTGNDSSAPAARRIVRIDGETSKNQHALAEIFSVIWLTPQMDGLFRDSASSRRKFLDRMVYHFDASHARRVTSYEHAVRERSKLLQSPHPDRYWLDTIEHTIAETGTAIAYARVDTLHMLQHTIQQTESMFPRAIITLDGEVEQWVIEGSKSLECEENYRRKLFEARTPDSISGRSSVGVHRSDMRTIHEIKQMPAEYCSTGEQKALLLSITLAEARARSHWRQSIPVLLLDEVVAHLDTTHRDALYEELLAMNAQSWMTGTDSELFTSLQQDAQFFTIQQGEIYGH